MGDEGKCQSLRSKLPELSVSHLVGDNIIVPKPHCASQLKGFA